MIVFAWNRMSTGSNKGGPVIEPDLAYSPTEERLKMWLVGVGLAMVPSIYGVVCLVIGKTQLAGRWGEAVELTGAAGKALALAFIFGGVMIHAHWFWGLHPRLEGFSPPLKALALIGFIVCLGYTVIRFLSDTVSF
jgi:hypothetical protein